MATNEGKQQRASPWKLTPLQWKYVCIIGLWLVTIISPIAGIGYVVGWCIVLHRKYIQSTET